MVPEKRVSLTLRQLPEMKQKMIVRQMKPAKFRQKETKSPGASMNRVNAPMPPIKDEEANIITKPMSLYFAD